MPNAASLWEKFQQGEGTRPRAVRKFTDRQDFRQACYALVLRAIEEDFRDYYIMNYYGLGGAGKSALLRRLEEELLGDRELADDEARAACLAVRERLQKLSRHQKPAVLRADFDDAALNSPEDVLLRFRSQLLRQNDKAVFPLFDMAMLRLSQKYGRRLPPDEQKELVTDNPVISFALDAIGDLTGVGLLIGAAQTAAKVGQGLARTLAGRKSAIKKANTEMSRMDAPDLERRLPYYFSMDVNAMGLPLVCVYLDTYEKMTARAEGAGRSTGFYEEWLRGDWGLVRNLGSAVFVIAGREQLRWTGLPFEERYIEALSQADSVDFLTSCGIEDRALCARLYRLTGGEPIYLDLCVDEYERLTDPGSKERKAPEDLTLEDFGGNRDRLVERHTRYIPQNLRDALYLLAAMGRWSDAVCEELSRTLPIPSPAGTEYYQLTHLSYVRQEEESWVMHRPVAEVLARELTPALRQRLTQSLLWAAEAESQAVSAGSAAKGKGPDAMDILDKLSQAAPESQIARAMGKRAEALCDAGRYPEARRWQERSATLWKALGGGYADRYGESLATLADILHEWLKNQPNAFKQEGASATGEADVERVLQEQRGWREVQELCRESIQTCQELGNGLDEALARLWTVRASAEDTLGDLDASLSSWTRAMELDRKLGLPEAVWRNAQFQIGKNHWHSNRRDEACTVLEDTLCGFTALDRQAGRAYSPKTLTCAELLCEVYCLLVTEKPEPAKERLTRVEVWLQSLELTVTGDEPLEELLDWQEWILASEISFGYHSGGEEAGSVKRMQRLIDLNRQVVTGLAKYLGELHPTVLYAKRALVNLYINQEGAKNINAMMDSESYIASVIDDAYGPVGSVPAHEICYVFPEAAVAVCRELVELHTKAMGREDPGTYEAKDMLARAYFGAGRIEGSISVRQELWSYYSRVYGETSQKALRENSALIDACRRIKRWDEAIALQSRRLERARVEDTPLSLGLERDMLCTLYLSRLWQEEGLSWDQAREHLSKLLALMEELKPLDRKRYLDSAWQWCLEYAGDGLDEVVIDVVLALADSMPSLWEEKVIELLEPYSEERTLLAQQRCAVLFRLGKAYRELRGGQARSVEILEELAELLEDRPEAEDPDLGSALLELGLSRRKLVLSLTGSSVRKTALEMLEALRGALAWREEHPAPEDPAADRARSELASALTWVGKHEEAIPLWETVLAYRRDTLDEDAEETVRAELKLVEALACTDGRYKQALALFRQAQRHMEGMRFSPSTLLARYALYRGDGGTLSVAEWQEAGEPEHD